MNELSESIIWVVTGANFWVWSATIFIIGTFWGWKQNHGMTGFRQSLITIAPLILIYFFASANRVYEYTQLYGLGAQSFNNLVTIVLIALTYVVGLLVGHNIKNKAIDSAIEEADLPEKQKHSMKVMLKESL